MSDYRETNPHFHPPQQQLPPHGAPHLHPQQDDTDHRRPPRQHRRRQNQYPKPEFVPIPAHPHYPPHDQPPTHQTQQPQPHHIPTPYIPPPQHRTTGTTELHHDPDTDHFALHPPPQPLHSPPPRHTPHGPPPHQSPPPLPPHRPHKTRPHTWLIGACCALFWTLVFFGGLVVLIVYLIFRPKIPKFDISSASLNAAYLDMGYLLNADMTLLANFTNPSRKATVNFHYMVISLYYERTLIATTYVEPFKSLKAMSNFRNVHLVISQAWLSSTQSQHMGQQIESNRVRFEVKALMKTRSNLGSLFRYSYWLYGHCIIEVTGPPSGILVGKRCVTKR